jgi:transcriptional regulator GlxA family with amidase domain
MLPATHYDMIFFYKTFSFMNIKNEDLEKALIIKAVIEKEYYKDFTVPDLAQRVGSNKKILNAAFKQITSKTIMMYRTEIRIEKAKDLLVETDDCIERIATRVGLDRRNLEKQFKRLTEKTPKEWKTENKRGYQAYHFELQSKQSNN